MGRPSKSRKINLAATIFDLRFSTFTGSFTGARFIEFAKKLMADTDGPIYLVVDGHPAHRAKLVKDFVASTDGALRLFVLPAYSPRAEAKSSGDLVGGEGAVRVAGVMA
ncbi:MAG: transposase [Dehalococcoidia bacterium]